MRNKTSFIPVIPLLVLVIAGQGCTPMSAKFQRAQTHQEKGQYEQPEQIYKQIIRDHPGTEDAFQAQKNLAILYVAWDKQPQAQATLQEFFSEYEAITTAVTHVADACRKLEKHEKACEIYHYVVDNWPKDKHAM